MNIANSVGFFGKLPAHGDFIHRDLPSHFINVWDEWLQGFVGSSKEQIGEGWLDIYLTSPIWRFAFSEGVIDQNAWAGIFMPSVDRVGRYFPFSVAKRLSNTQNPFDIINQTEWYDAIESAALQALNGQLKMDELIQEINAPRLPLSLIYSPASGKLNASNSIIKMDFEEELPQSVYAHLLGAVLKDSLSSVSVWNTRGSELVEPCLFYSRGLPPVRSIVAMLDGQWEQSGWHQPYMLNQL